MVAITDLHSEEDFEALCERSQSQPVVLLKYSSACGLSTIAQERFVPLANDGTPLYRVVVQRARHLSDHIAEATGIRHETPQALVFFGGRVIHDASHHRISTESLRDAARAAPQNSVSS